MKKSFIRIVCYLIAVVALIVMLSGCLLSQPTWRHNQPSQLSVAPERLHSHVLMLSETFYPRDWKNTANLNSCVQYITSLFKESGAVASIQPVPVQGHEYQNVIARFGVGLRVVILQALTITPAGLRHCWSSPICLGNIRHNVKLNWSLTRWRSRRFSERR